MKNPNKKPQKTGTETSLSKQMLNLFVTVGMAVSAIAIVCFIFNFLDVKGYNNLNRPDLDYTICTSNGRETIDINYPNNLFSEPLTVTTADGKTTSISWSNAVVYRDINEMDKKSVPESEPAEFTVRMPDGTTLNVQSTQYLCHPNTGNFNPLEIYKIVTDDNRLLLAPISRTVKTLL